MDQPTNNSTAHAYTYVHVHMSSMRIAKCLRAPRVSTLHKSMVGINWRLSHQLAVRMRIMHIIVRGATLVFLFFVLVVLKPLMSGFSSGFSATKTRKLMWRFR